MEKRIYSEQQTTANIKLSWSINSWEQVKSPKQQSPAWEQIDSPEELTLETDILLNKKLLKKEIFLPNSKLQVMGPL